MYNETCIYCGKIGNQESMIKTGNSWAHQICAGCNGIANSLKMLEENNNKMNKMLNHFITE